MATPTKYRKKFVKQLIEGLRQDGKSIEEVCCLWNISVVTYNAWKDKYPEFKEATEIGERDKNAWWHKTHRDVSSGVRAGNAACLNFGMKNQANWVDKQEVHTTHDERINTIRIEMLPPRTERLGREPVVIDGKGN